jgi:hypothetical protein
MVKFTTAPGNALKITISCRGNRVGPELMSRQSNDLFQHSQRITRAEGPKSATLLRCVFHMLLDVTKLCVSLTEGSLIN